MALVIIHVSQNYDYNCADLRGFDRAKEDYHQDPSDDYYGNKRGGKRIPD